MKIRIAGTLVEELRHDLRRPHEFAYERVAFLFGRLSEGEIDDVLILTEYAPVADGDYLDDSTASATIGRAAIRTALQRVLSDNLSCFHVHEHAFGGRYFSAIDEKTVSELSSSFSAAAPNQRHGGLVLTPTSAIGKVLNPRTRKLEVTGLVVVGNPIQFHDMGSEQ